ncbi:MAG: disulfide bond formation protein B [Burkholderiales bacterium]|nr:disulfide bond formation protein B [Burkholderiales bacterium]MDG1225229.1 disulfide bond formation protein B [Burkholderiales bacterium]
MTISKTHIRSAEFLGCSGLIAFALFLQHSEGLAPCPMCILQRYAFIIIGILALVSLPISSKSVFSRMLNWLIILFSGFGAGVALRHTWLEHNPPEIFDCGADLGFVVDTFPLAQALPMIFRGTGDCSVVLWKFAGLSIAEWALVCFIAILIIEIWHLTKRGRIEIS